MSGIWRNYCILVSSFLYNIHSAGIQRMAGDEFCGIWPAHCLKHLPFCLST